MHAQPLRAADSVEWNADIYGVFLVFFVHGMTAVRLDFWLRRPEAMPFYQTHTDSSFPPRGLAVL